MTQGVGQIVSTFLKKPIWVPSHPVDILGFSFFKTCLTIFGVNVTVLKPSPPIRATLGQIHL